MQRCRICNKKTIEEYCEYHREAYRNLEQKYAYWRTALKISWTEYLQEVRVNPHTGLWVKEVAAYLISFE